MKYAESYVQIFLETDMAVENGIFHIRTVNDGPIVPDTMKEEIFKPFVRFNGEENGKVTSGTGIGLALSRSLAELHRGSLRMVEGEDANIFALLCHLPKIMLLRWNLGMLVMWNLLQNFRRSGRSLKK